MSPRLLGDIKTTDIISRFRHLAVPLNCLLDSSVLPNSAALGGSSGASQLINRGEVLAAYIPNDASVHVGKYRPYFESLAVGIAFSNASVNFAINPSLRASVWLVAGDVIEKSDGTAIGTVATYNAVTGLGTLTGNSANNVAVGAAVRLVSTTWGLANKLGLISEDEVLVEQDADQPTSAYREGFFMISRTSLTAAAITALGGAYMESPGVVASASNEVRIQ